MGQALQIVPLKFGELVNIDHAIFTLNRNQGVKMRAPVIAWLILGAGHPILVDTGPCNPEMSARYHIALEQPKSPATVLREAGVDPSEIRTVVLTHLHWDHCWNLELFPNAEFVIQERELHYAVNPLPCHRAIYDLHLPHPPPWATVLHRMRVLRGDYALAPGVQVYHLPGHSPGMQGVCVDTAEGRQLIAGDNVALFWNWEHRHPSGHFVDLDEYYRTLDRMATIADRILPGHDPAVFQTLTGVE